MAEHFQFSQTSQGTLRLFVAGFQHETNNFGVGQAGLTEFTMADSWPGLLRGADVINGTRGINLPIAGFIEAAEAAGNIELVPGLWCAAEPSGPVTSEAFESIASWILEGICSAGDLDGIYLDLHGAMVTDNYDDGEGELLKRVRDQVGEAMPLMASLDMHANVTAEMLQQASALCIFRTYPHLDMAETGARCLEPLLQQINGLKLYKALRQAPFLVPVPAQQTGGDPARRLYDDLIRESNGTSGWVDMALGFSAADIASPTPGIVAYAATQVEADALADRALERLLMAEQDFDAGMLSARDAVEKAIVWKGRRPVVIADVQDNAGAGAASDTVGLLSELLRQEAQGVIMGLLHDAEMAGKAHHYGVGAVFEAGLGGKSGKPGQSPFRGCFRVDALGDGQCVYTGEMYRGATATLGPCAVLRVMSVKADVQIVVSSIRQQCLDQAHFTHIGLDPSAAEILCVKSTAHFRADFEPIAGLVLIAAAPGAFPCELEKLPYTKLLPGIRIA